MIFKPTSAQLSFYTGNIDIDSYLWNQGVMQVFPKHYSYEELNEAHNKLVKANESLRIKLEYTDEGCVMKLVDFKYKNYPHWVLSSEEELNKKAKEFLNEPLDFNDDLVRCAIFETPEISGIMISGHHMFVDGYSVTVMAEHTNKYLEDPDYMPEAYQTYCEYSQNEEKHKLTKRYQRDHDFWKNEFDPMPLCQFYADSSMALDYSSSELNISISSELFDAIKEICKKEAVSVQTFFNSVYATYFYRNSTCNRFTLGVPVLNRTTPAEFNTIGLYMHIVPMVIDVEESISFFKLLQKIEYLQMNLFRHQKYTQYEIKKMLEKQDLRVNRLFDVIADYQEFKLNDSYEIKLPYSNDLSVPLEIHMQSFGNEKHNLKIRYRTSMFNKKEIGSVINSFVAIIEDALENPDKKISELNMISKDEQKLLDSFNDTTVEYEKDKCIHELFEIQSEATPDKTAIVACDRTLTYRQLNEEANAIAHTLIDMGIGKGDIVGLMLPRKSALLSALLGILKSGAAYLPIDPDHPEDRIRYMLSDSGAKLCIDEKNIGEFIVNSNRNNPEIKVCGADLCYCIYTSGSTGKPKGTLLTHQNVVNYVSSNDKNIFFGVTGKDCESILSVTTVGFDIFVTESLLPLANGLRIILADENQARLQSKLSELLKMYPADVMQTTPTKMKSLMADKSQREYLKYFKTIILGGESLDSTVVKELQSVTDAEIYNVYGPTEATVWMTTAKIDNPDDITIGKPLANTQVYILDKNMKLVPVGVTGELCIAGDCVCAGYLNRDELTAEKFIDNPYGEGKLYKTGDLAYWREDGNIIFIGRNDFQVKIRGLRIELGEIESVLQTVEGINHAVAVVRKDKSDRQLICAFYTGEEKKVSEIKDIIGDKLPKYMIPHIFTHIEEMPLTGSGKVNRNALPEIDLENICSDTEYVAPETKQEIILAECISAVLDIEKISVLDNFFDIGGDSLKSIELTAKLEAKGYEVPVKTIFECKDIRALAAELSEKQCEYIKAEYDSVLAATPAQMRVYTAQMLAPGSPLYNVTYAFKVSDVDKNRLETAINKLIGRHESFRTHFENREGTIYQVIDETAMIKVEEVADINTFSKAFDLSKSPFIRVGCNSDTVVVDMHHIAVDGETVPILFRELNDLYMGRELSDEVVQYGEFAVTNKHTAENERYWLEVFREEVLDLDLPKDYQRPAVQSFAGSVKYRLIEKAIHNKIEVKCKELGITPYVYYTACLNVLLAKLSGNEDIVTGTPVSGRTSRFLGTVGMFVNTVALRSRPEGNKEFAELLNEIKETTISAIDNQNYPFGELVKKLGVDTAGRNPLFDVMLAYQSFEMTDITFGDEKAELVPLTTATAKCDMTFNILPRKDDVVLATEYCTALYTEDRIEKFIDMYCGLLEDCLDESRLIMDISVINEEDRTLLDSFNDTPHTYAVSEDSTIYSLFEKTAKENRDKVCLHTAEKTMTYGELISTAEALDAEIRKITKDEKSVIAVIAERSAEMYSAIYGIIRGGNAYLPIDPDYPQDRIDFILDNSKAAAVVTQGKFKALVGNAPCIDMTELLADIDATYDIPTQCAQPEDTAYVIYTSGSTGTPKGAKVSHQSAVNRILWMHDKYPLNPDDVILQKTPYTFDVSVWEHFWWGMVGAGLAASKPGEHFLPAKILDEVERNKVTHLHFVPSVFELFLNYLEAHKEELSKFSSVRYVFVSGEALMANLVQRFYALFDFDKVTLNNLYGPTECAVDVTYYDCTPDDIDPVPIGKPIYNTQMHVVDKYMNQQPIGVIGELCIAGVNVGQGYLGNEKLTAEKFIDNPFGEGKLYKTGDLAYWREDGNIIFCGRKDSQIKLGGQRIEIGEIEAVITMLTEVESAAVVVNRETLVAFYCGEKGCEEQIKDTCAAKLPKYMVPTAVINLDKIPLNQNGKLDRKALSQLKFEIASNEKNESPANDTEKFICRTFENILGETDVGRNSDFFSLGGTSLSMISILSEDGFEGISAAEFMSNPTPAKLAMLMDAKNMPETEYLETLFVPDGATDSLILLPFAGGGAEAFGKLVASVKQRSKQTAVYFVRYLHSFDECQKAANEISRVLSKTEISIYSHCVGSAVALQLLKNLEKDGIRIKRYYAGASIPPSKTAKRNSWNIVPDFILKRILNNAGAGMDKLSNDVVKDILRRFRLDTDFSVISYADNSFKLKTPAIIIVSKYDVFTKNYDDAKALWKKYFDDVYETHFIDTQSHYFQSVNSDDVADIIIGK